MPFPVLLAERVAQIVVAGHAVQTGGGVRRILNGFIYGQRSGVLPFDKARLATSFNEQIWLTIAQQLSSSWIGDQIYVKDLGDANDDLEPVVTPHSGFIPGNRLPLSDAVFIRLRTAYRGYWAQGRKFFGPIPVSSSVGDELSPAVQPAWQNISAAVAANLIETLEQFWSPAVVSRRYSLLDSNPTTIIGGYLTDTILSLTLSTWRHRRETVQRPGQLRSRGGMLLDGRTAFQVAATIVSRGGLLLDGSDQFG